RFRRLDGIERGSDDREPRLRSQGHVDAGATRRVGDGAVPGDLGVTTPENDHAAGHRPAGGAVRLKDERLGQEGPRDTPLPADGPSGTPPSSGRAGRTSATAGRPGRTTRSAVGRPGSAAPVAKTTSKW